MGQSYFIEVAPESWKTLAVLSMTTVERSSVEWENLKMF